MSDNCYHQETCVLNKKISSALDVFRGHQCYKWSCITLYIYMAQNINKCNESNKKNTIIQRTEKLPSAKRHTFSSRQTEICDQNLAKSAKSWLRTFWRRQGAPHSSIRATRRLMNNAPLPTGDGHVKRTMASSFHVFTAAKPRRAAIFFRLHIRCSSQVGYRNPWYGKLEEYVKATDEARSPRLTFSVLRKAGSSYHSVNSWENNTRRLVQRSRVQTEFPLSS